MREGSTCALDACAMSTSKPESRCTRPAPFASPLRHCRSGSVGKTSRMDLSVGSSPCTDSFTIFILQDFLVRMPPGRRHHHQTDKSTHARQICPYGNI